VEISSFISHAVSKRLSILSIVSQTNGFLHEFLQYSAVCLARRPCIAICGDFYIPINKILKRWFSVDMYVITNWMISDPLNFFSAFLCAPVTFGGDAMLLFFAHNRCALIGAVWWQGRCWVFTFHVTLKRPWTLVITARTTTSWTPILFVLVRDFCVRLSFKAVKDSTSLSGTYVTIRCCKTLFVSVEFRYVQSLGCYRIKTVNRITVFVICWLIWFIIFYQQI